ncbi:fumarylacetoacetate hydrolase family protein [Nocardia brasiliensis NBRC 14402]|nr:fumarylacetoacetate hydrolase family protein [Nocardia brasiliensis NBRC 14402]
MVVDGAQAYDLTPLTRDIDGEFLAAGGIAATAAALAAGELPRVEIDGQRIGAPIARPQAVWCIGMNYAAHAAESGAAPPRTPVVFFKTPNTVIGPYDDVLIPKGSEKTDWEVELAVVIGKRARYLDSVEQALDHVAGYTVSNDVSERAFQLEESGGQWSKGKCCETFNPLGPALVPRDRLDPANLRLRSFVNGVARQDASTADLIFDVAYLVWHLSQYAVLEPGDVVNTGTPAGVALSGRYPYLRAGDLVEVEIEGIGRAGQRCRAAE